MSSVPISVTGDMTAEPAPRSGGILLRGVSMIYAGNVRALSAVDLHIPRGQHVAVLGSSGSGKTTLLGCLSRRLEPTTGEIRCDGRIATIHQDLRLVKSRSALSNVLHGSLGRHSLWRTLVRFPRHERQRAEKLLQRVGLGQRVHASVGRLSGGEQQRVAIARALMQDPAVLLADEPVASLDNGNARGIMQLLSELQRERGLTLITVLHDCALAESFADRIVGLANGRVVHDDRGSHGNSCLSIGGDLGEGLRGFRRFDPCRACEHLVAQAEAEREEPAPAARPAARPWWYALAAIAVLAVYAWSVTGLGVTGREAEGFFSNMLGFMRSMVPRSWSQLTDINWASLGASLLVTFQMALLGTTLAVIISWPMAALAARNVGPGWIRPAMRLLLNAVRSVPSILWALLFVAAGGLGAVAGVLALVAYSIGYLTKFFYEAFEAVDAGAPDALREIGASGPQRFLHAVWPAARAAVLSSSLFMLEYNVRAASVLGIVGAGGIGQELKLYLEWRAFHVVAAIMLILIAVVLVLDAISSRIRARLTHG